jgi:hypothetical protein
MQERQTAREYPAFGEDTSGVTPNWAEIQRQVKRMVHERPLASVLGAVLAGYLVARLTSRW